MSKRIGGTLENWKLIDFYTSGELVIVGDVYGDDNWREGEHIRTSRIVSLTQDTVETLNTVYKLGKMSKQYSLD